ncbi:hypothetical protein Tsubulata_019152 [Turnera subulata]|uniref:DUF4408 domain-containing protein n=1 Tax=Turnera subulata TaxID=218843 RepID=A0A9Q0JIP8_9ROSI|nr:hypothetical protein Tsubulata_019152 [Turnera subulata]
MDLIQLQKIHAINKAKKQQRLGKIFLYSITALTFSLFCSSVLWFPDVTSSMKLFTFDFVPKISAVLFSPKSIFIVGNLIIVVLVGESKFFASSSPPASDVYYNEYINRKKSLQTSSALEEKKVKKMEKPVKEKPIKLSEDRRIVVRRELNERSLKAVEKERVYLDGEEEGLSLPTEELNKRAEDFIARVNRQFMLEARAVVCCG